MYCNVQPDLLHNEKCFALYFILFTNLPLTSFPPSVQYTAAVDYGESYDYYGVATPTDTPNEFSESQVKRKKKKKDKNIQVVHVCGCQCVLSGCHLTPLVLVSSVIY